MALSIAAPCDCDRRPVAKVPTADGARWPETYWLVKTDSPIEWNGEPAFAERWSPDHPLCHSIQPTRLALVMASSSWSGPVGWTPAGVPVYPVAGAATSVAEAEPIGGLAIKAGIRAP